MKGLLEAGASQIGRELGEVETILKDRLDSGMPVVDEQTRYLVDSGGKRYRPALVITFYKLLDGEGDHQAMLDLAAIIELIHLATLAHDDVIDRAPQRRSRPSLWQQAGTRAAILEGDFIFSRAFRMLNSHPHEIRRRVIEAVEALLEGEILQESLRWQIPSLEAYFRAIEGKTAELISVACEVGALVGCPSLDDGDRRNIRRAGLNLGTAYQMIDDWLDVFGDERSGKPRGTDRRGGWLTWPYLRLLELSDEPDAWSTLMLKESLSDAEQASLMGEMERFEIAQQHQEAARRMIGEAKEALSWLPDTGLKALLFGSFDFVAERAA